MSIPLPTGTCEASGDLHTAQIMPENPTIEIGIFSNALFENIPCLYNSLLSKLSKTLDKKARLNAYLFSYVYNIIYSKIFPILLSR